MIPRALFFVLVFVPALIVIIPVQFLILRLRLPFPFALPRFFHRLACIFLGIRVSVLGQVANQKPVLLLANHIAWTDIVVLSAVADMVFVGKAEIEHWPVVGFMAALQRTLYVDRTRRSDTGRATNAITERLAGGDAVLIFAEGRSGIGTHVLPFRSALIGAAQSALEVAGTKTVAVQPVTIGYKRLQGLPISRNQRSDMAWSKSKNLGQNIRAILSSGARDVEIVFGEVIFLGPDDDRKVIARRCEDEVRKTLNMINRGAELPAPSKMTTAG